jgi:hypothetical protein
MYRKQIILTLIFWILSISAYSQISYSYTDPCTGAIKTLQVPSSGVTVTYYGQVNTFQPADFYNGGFESWAQGVFGSFGNNNPCASIVGLPAAINVAQNTAINFLGTINTISSLSSLSSIGGSSNLISGAVNSTQNSTSNSKKDKSTQGGNGGASNGNTSTNNQNTNANGNTNGGGTGQGQTNAGSNGSTGSTEGGTSGSGTSGSGTSGSGTSGSGTEGGTNTTSEPPGTEEGGKTNLVGSSVNSVQNSTSGGNPSNKNGNRPTVLASSDFVGFQFQNSDVAVGGKFTGGYASMRWDGARSWGINMDYTTALRGPNITGYYAFMKPKRIDLISVTGTIGFEAQPTLYGTLSVGQMWSLNKPKNMKLVYMLTGSFGQVYGADFIGTAAIAGGMYDFKITNRFDFKVLMLYVYAPYVSYYNDILLKSPHVVLPIIGTNINLTKRFKLNINTGGAWAVKDAALNYTIMLGTRMLL